MSHCPSKHHLTFLLLLGSLLCIQPAYSQSKAQLEKQKRQTEQEIKRLNNELAKTKKNTKNTAAQLNLLNKKIKERNKLINNINAQLGILSTQIHQTQDSITRMQGQVDSMKAQYARIVRALYREHDNLDRMVLLFDTPSFNRSFLRLKYFSAYSRYRRHQAHLIQEKQDELAITNDKLQRQRDEQGALLTQAQKNKAALTKDQEQKQKSLNQSKANEKSLNQQLAKKEKQKRELDAKIQKIIAEEVAKSSKNKGTSTAKPGASGGTSSNADLALSSDFAGNKGRLGWPCYYKRVMREYGRYTHESGGVNMNNGIDLETAPGAAVYAVFQGTASRVFQAPNGTRCVIIRHGNYMTVYAGMGSVSVREGAKVATKQQIGTVADAGGHGEFSFQIWKERDPQNPRNWLR